MRAVAARVTEASVTVDGEIVGAIDDSHGDDIAAIARYSVGIRHQASGLSQSLGIRSQAPAAMPDPDA